jgi:hypothetical protein
MKFVSDVSVSFVHFCLTEEGGFGDNAPDMYLEGDELS